MSLASDKKDFSYYTKCLIGGTLASSFSHLIFTPLDLYKTMKQSDIGFLLNLKDVMKKLHAKSGLRGVYTGWQPTVQAYGVHGMIKYTTYEFVKTKSIKWYGGDLDKYRYRICLISAGVAEFFANLLICPLEVKKIRLQSSTLTKFSPGNENNGLNNNTNHIEENIKSNFKKEKLFDLYKGIGLILLRQIPLTMSVFCTFEATCQVVYKYIYKKPRTELSLANHLIVSLIASYMSGSIFCAIVSHPADTIITNIYKFSNNQLSGKITDNVKQIYRELKFKGLFTGLYPRGFYLGFLIPTQLFLYDVSKVCMGLKTTASV